MRAIEPDDVSGTRSPGIAIKPTATTAASATTAAATRQNVSLRRIRRRSTITSESSDIEILPKNNRCVLRRQRDHWLIRLHQLRRNLKKTRPPASSLRPLWEKEEKRPRSKPGP